MFMLTVIHSIMARPSGHKFGVCIMGQNFDLAGLADPEKFKDFVHTETGRTDLEFGDFSWLSYFRYIFLDFVEFSKI